jgi:bifunctional non-homologous end joining protein LigD
MAGMATRHSGRDTLDEYRSKRDFHRTREPAGGRAATSRRGRSRRRRRLAFVIQKHAASHLHFDLRLELDGVMRSWAVPKGPSLDPSVKRLAMQVEDHPIEYNTFEGTIPEDEYGGGTVMLWDRGTYRPDEPRPGESDEDAVRRGLRAGKLSFSFDGERLRGSFALVRTDRGPKPKWLLIKHRDDTADPGPDITQRVVTSVASGRTMDEITAETDRVWRSNRSAGAGKGPEKRARTTATATARPDDALIAPMRPTPATDLPAGDDWTFEPWRGGERALAYVTATGARFVDDAGHDITREHEPIATALAALSDRIERSFILDGELADDDGAATFFAADLLIDGDTVLLGRPWAERREALRKLLYRRRVPAVTRQDSVGEGQTMVRRAAARGWPGVIARRTTAPYTPGERSDALLRITA